MPIQHLLCSSSLTIRKPLWVKAALPIARLQILTGSTNTVGKMEGGGAQYSSLIGLQLDTYIDMTTSEKTITFQFYTTEAVPMNGLLQLNGEQDGGNPIEMRFTTDGNIGWETITLDFNDAKNGYPNGDVPVVYGQYATVNVFSNFGDTGSSTYYIDAIRGAANGAAVGSDPGTDPDPDTDPDPVTGLIAAPTPGQDSADVISVYSDVYTSIATNLNPFWGQQTDATEIQLDGNLTLKYANLNYQGLEYPATDVSAMEYVHLDYYTDDATALDFYLISENPTVENAYTISIVTGDWQSVDIPLSVYNANLDRVFQFKTVGNGTVYFDNIYFWKEPAAAGTDTTLSALTVDGSTIANFGALSSSYSVELPAGTTVVPTVAATTTDTNASAVVTAATSIPGTTTIVVTAQDGATTNTVSIAWTLDPKPQTAAPTPSQDSADVISVYSDAFTENIATNLNPGWGQATQTAEVDIAGNNTLEYANLNYQGLEYPQTDVSAMEYVHLDYYTDDATALDFYLVSAYANFDTAFGIPIVTGSWQSVDIPLSAYNFTVEELDKVFQFKTVGNGTVYLDNLYFWKAPAVAGTQLADLTVDGKSIAGFGATSTNYSIELPAGTTVVPTVAATTTDTNASAVVTAAAGVPGTTTIFVTAQDGVTTNTISIAWTLDPKPQTAAPIPSQDSADVISVYSDAFTENIATNLNPNWGQATAMAEILIDGNNALEYASLNYQGLEYPQTDVSAMEYVHLDYFTNDATALDFFLISTGPKENAYSIDIVTGSWQSIDIPLSAYNFTVEELENVFQFKTTGNGTVYFDNIYFWKAPAAQGTDISLSALTVDGSSIVDFGALKTSYSLELPAGTTVVPTVAATPTDTNASAVVTAATSLPGTTTLVVTAQDGVTTNTVSIAFTLESTDNGADPTPTLLIEFNNSEAFVGQGGVTYSEATDPTDSTNTVGKMEGGGAQYSSLIGLQLDTYIDMTTSEKTITFQFYTTEAVPMNGMLQLNGEQDGGNPIEMRFTTDGNIGWETITLDFNDAKNGYPYGDVPVVYGQYATVNVFSNFGDTGSSTYYIDAIRGAANGAAVGSGSGTDPDPVTGLIAAPTPSQDSADVIAVYSDAYTSIATALDPFWGQQTDATEIQIDGNLTLKYANLNYQGLEYPQTDVSAMEYVHLDYYTDDATALDFFLISADPYIEIPYSIPLVIGSWQSVDIPLSAYIFTVEELENVFQFKTEGNGTVWFDNLYFWKAPTAAGTDTSLSDLTLDASTISGFASLATSYSVVLPSGTSVVPTVTAATTDAGASAVVTAASSLPGDTTIAVTAADGVTTSTITVSFTIDPTPTVAAPTPSNDSADVISVYSDAFTSIVTDTAPNWGQSTVVSQIDVAGDNALQYAGLNYQGMIYPATDVSTMEYLHVDYYTEDATSLQLFLIAGGEVAYDISATDGITTGQWVGVDIPMSTYASLTLTAANQFKTVGNGTVWFDNIYFWKAPAVAGTELSDLTLDGSTIADFRPTRTSYSVEFPYGTTAVPTVAATPTDTNASAVVTDATSIPGTTTIDITAQDGVTTNTVSIAFSIYPSPTTAAPTPSQDSADVISVYSDAYTSNRDQPKSRFATTNKSD